MTRSGTPSQRQLVTEGWFHGYLRMLWGKKILEWSPRPADALERMQSLMDRYALDGRDPNSYAGYAWVLGRYDRPWPRRPIFGTIRYMSSASTKRKLKMKRFLERMEMTSADEYVPRCRECGGGDSANAECRVLNAEIRAEAGGMRNAHYLAAGSAFTSRSIQHSAFAHLPWRTSWTERRT